MESNFCIYLSQITCETTKMSLCSTDRIFFAQILISHAADITR